jgi:hypothetical protein
MKYYDTIEEAVEAKELRRRALRPITPAPRGMGEVRNVLLTPEERPMGVILNVLSLFAREGKEAVK